MVALREMLNIRMVSGSNAKANRYATHQARSKSLSGRKRKSKLAIPITLRYGYRLYHSEKVKTLLHELPMCQLLGHVQ
jgi:hypothetical protein